MNPQIEAGESGGYEEAEETEATPEVPNPVAPPVIRPKAVKRKLVLKDDPKAERLKPQRVSQRCLGKWAASKVKPNTEADPVEILSEEEETTPTKSGEELLPATGLEDAAMGTKEVSPTQSGQGEGTDGMAEGLDLASRSVGHEGKRIDNTLTSGETSPTAQEQFSTQAAKEPEEKKAEDDGGEGRYRAERKRKGKAIMKKKPSNKRPRTVNTGIVITESVQRTPSSRREQSDSEYEISEESESDSDTSMEDEEYKEQQLPNDHRELLHPPAERLRYKRWAVELTDDVVEEMKLFDSKKLQDAYRTKDDKSKQIKCGKVLHLPSLDELKARESFLALLHALGFEWLLENEVLNVPVKLAKEFFATFRFKVTTDLDEECISFRLFGGEIRLSLIEWTVRLGMCSLEEAIGPEWRDRERGIPRRHVEFEPQVAWEELTHTGAGQFQSTISRSIHLNDPILRLVQLFLDFNLLGQSNSAVRTSMTELYLMWCAKKGRKLHLGFWTAYQCHLIATHPARNLSLCHLLGIFVRNNITVSEGEDLSPLTMVAAPGLFDTPLFVRTNAVYMRQGVPHFYAMGEEALPTARVAAAQGAPAHEQRQERMEKAVDEITEENRQMRSEMTRLASVMEGILKESAGQRRQNQRQEALETIVTRLGEENHRMIAEMTRMTSVIDEILMVLAQGRQEDDVGPSGHGGRNDEQQIPETEEGEAEVPANAEEPAEFDEDQTGTNREQPPALPAPRKSRRHR